MVTKQNRKGFTLIELLVVIAIIGLLSTLAIVALGNAQTRARDAKRLADVKQIQTALALYFNESTKVYFPFEVNTGAGEILGAAAAAKLNSDDTFTTAVDASTPTYLATVPSDPSQTAACTRGAAAFPGTLAAPAAGCAYTYWSNGTAVGPSNTQYELGFSLELGSSGLAAGIHCATEGGLSGALCSH